MGVVESTASKSASASAKSIATAAFDFVINETHNGLCLVELGPTEQPATHFDAIYVIAMPLEKAKFAAVNERLMHSVVILVQKATGIGHMLEYTNSHTVKMSKPGRIAEKQGYFSNHRSFSQFNKGFQSCNISLDMLLQFNKRFERISNYQVLNHDCQIYHRSLVASAVQKKYLYNLRTESNPFSKLVVNSDVWVELPDSATCRKDVMVDQRTKHSLTTWLQKDSALCEVKAVSYDPDLHKIISAEGMQLSADDMIQLSDAEEQRRIREEQRREREEQEARTNERIEEQKAKLRKREEERIYREEQAHVAQQRAWRLEEKQRREEEETRQAHMAAEKKFAQNKKLERRRLNVFHGVLFAVVAVLLFLVNLWVMSA
jgi:hypothetical protein